MNHNVNSFSIYIYIIFTLSNFSNSIQCDIAKNTFETISQCNLLNGSGTLRSVNYSNLCYLKNVSRN